MTDMRVEPLTGSLGAEVHGVDLADDPPVEALRAAWLRHKVLFFRGQDLTPVTHAAWLRRFGALTPAHPLIPGHPEAPEVLVLDSASYELGVGRKERTTSYNNQWHTDVTFSATPPAGTGLLAVQVPRYGGDTVWADLGAAFRALSPPLRGMLRGMFAEHSAAKAFAATVQADQGERDTRLRANPPTAHPVVRVHPETGEEVLFVNPTFTTRILDVAPLESDALLAMLFAWAPNPDWCVRWRWSPGDVAWWDNRSTMHFAAADYGDERRIMHRVTLAGDRPTGPTPRPADGQGGSATGRGTGAP